MNHDQIFQKYKKRKNLVKGICIPLGLIFTASFIFWFVNIYTNVVGFSNVWINLAFIVPSIFLGVFGLFIGFGTKFEERTYKKDKILIYATLNHSHLWINGKEVDNHKLWWGIYVILNGKMSDGANLEVKISMASVRFVCNGQSLLK